MARITVEDCLRRGVDGKEGGGNRFALVILAAQRAKQLLAGKKTLIENPENKDVVLALREIASGQVRFMTPEEQAEVERQKAEQEAIARAEAEAQAEIEAAKKAAAEASKEEMVESSDESGTPQLEDLFKLPESDESDSSDDEESDTPSELKEEAQV